MTKSLKASIVIPLRTQRDEWLEQCVRSALAQSEACEVLVVTATDTPQSNKTLLRRLAGENDRLRYFPRPHRGMAEAINAGWKQARTPRVGLLLSDDWLVPNAIEQCVALDADIVATGHIGYQADGTMVIWRRALSRDAFAALPTLERKASYLTHFFLFNRGLVLAMGGVDPEIGHVGPDDYDLPWTLLERGASVAFTSQPLYCYRDHEGVRLTLRPRQDQIADLRKILDKHRVPPQEQEVLIARKAPWLGVTCHSVIRARAQAAAAAGNTAPIPVTEPGKGTAAVYRVVGSRLETLIKTQGLTLRKAARVSEQASLMVNRASYRLEMEDGRVFKGRYLLSAEQAASVFELSASITHLPVCKVFAQRDNALLEEWVEGTPLYECATAGKRIDARIVEQAGELLGKLAATSPDQTGLGSARGKPDALLGKLDEHLAELERAGLLTAEQIHLLARLVRENAPERCDRGLVHLDVRPENLVLNPAGLTLIDHENLTIGELDQDLARTWYLWDMNRWEQSRFLAGYARHRNPISFFRHEPFWAVVILASAANFRLRIRQHPDAAIVALEKIAAEELPSPWLGHLSPGAVAAKPIRVALVCDYLAIGGHERMLLNMLSGLDSGRFERFVYAFRGGELAATIRSLGVPLVLGSQKDPLSWKHDWSAEDAREKADWGEQLALALRRDGIDAMVNFAWPPGVAAARKAGVAVTIERLDGPGLLGKIPDKSTFDSVVCESLTIAKDLLGRRHELKLDPKRLEMVYPGIDLRHFDPQRYDRGAERHKLGLDDDEVVIGYIGRLAMGKDIQLLLKALKILNKIPNRAFSRRGARLLIMGPDAGALASLHDLHDRLGLGDRVLFAEPREDVAPVLAALDIFATATRGEGIPTAVLEAMAMGLPIVASDVGSIHEIIEDNGCLIAEPTPGAFASALKPLAADPALRECWGQNSRRLARRFSLRYAIGRYEALIVEALERKALGSFDTA